ncbi:MAG: phage antirepressor KilAC domain-containing protein [Megasphaera cerevisiae]|nr:phage antirepressor KilAC domain-containing protein [Megasphaera cerevisiae]
MEKTMQIFENSEFGNIRTLVVDQEPWFVGKDIAEALGYANTRDALISHVDTEDKQCLRSQNTTFEIPNRGLTIINESGLYSLVLSSKLPTAKKFKRWVTAEVLPAIRKHGGYLTPEKVEDVLLNPDTIIRLATELKTERAKRMEHEKRLIQDRPKVIFANSVSVSDTSILISEQAKLLRQNGIDIGQNRMFQWLRDNRYLISRKGTDYNMPTQRSMDLGLFMIKETTINHSDGHISISKTPKVTGKGQIYFVNKFFNKPVGMVRNGEA